MWFSESFFMTFSFPANIRRLFLANNKTENLSCIDILKTHACVLVIIGQRMMYTTGQPLQNISKFEEVPNVLLSINIINYNSCCFRWLFIYYMLWFAMDRWLSIFFSLSAVSWHFIFFTTNWSTQKELMYHCYCYGDG